MFGALAIFSCLFITKDEPVHKRCCSAGEMWLHAVLFILHPIVLASAGLLWPAMVGLPASALSRSLSFTGFDPAFLRIVCALMIGFGLYQFIFWNMIWRPKKTAA